MNDKEIFTESEKPFDVFSRNIRNKQFIPLRTNIEYFDNLLDGGLMKQSISVLFGAPGIGKTTFVQQIAESFAIQGIDVIYFNLEMSMEQMYAKALTNYINQDVSKPVISTTEIILGYPWCKKNKTRIESAEKIYSNNNSKHITYNPPNTTNSFESIMSYINYQAKKCQIENKPCPIVFIDYLHLLKCQDAMTIQDTLRISLHRLKQYAVQNNTIVFTIVASNRRSNISGNFTIASGRDSSDIEFCADYVFSLGLAAFDQHTYYKKKLYTMEYEFEKNPRLINLKIHKNRWGKTGKDVLDFYPERSLFIKHNGYYNNKRY